MVLKSSCWVAVNLNSKFTDSVTKKMAIPKTQTVLSAVSRWTNWLNLFPWPTVQTPGWCAKSLARSWMRTTHPWCCLMAMFMDTMWVLKLVLCSALQYSVYIYYQCMPFEILYISCVYIVINIPLPLVFSLSCPFVKMTRWYAPGPKRFSTFPRLRRFT